MYIRRETRMTQYGPHAPSARESAKCGNVRYVRLLSITPINNSVSTCYNEFPFCWKNSQKTFFHENDWNQFKTCFKSIPLDVLKVAYSISFPCYWLDVTCCPGYTGRPFDVAKLSRYCWLNVTRCLGRSSSRTSRRCLQIDSILLSTSSCLGRSKTMESSESLWMMNPTRMFWRYIKDICKSEKEENKISLVYKKFWMAISFLVNLIDAHSTYFPPFLEWKFFSSSFIFHVVDCEIRKSCACAIHFHVSLLQKKKSNLKI